MSVANKTMTAIAALMLEDQGASFRQLFGETIKHAKDPFEPKNEEWRLHLGASIIGNECARQTWYSFRWATSKRHEGQLLRLFNRGHLEEPRFVALLLMIGCKVWQVDSEGKQFKIRNRYKGHFGGSLDGVAVGVPDYPDTPVLVEFKTHGEKSFLQLAEKGVQASKWPHFIQQQIYMDDFQLPASLYMAVNKNTDALHCEIVQYDKHISQKYRQLAQIIIDSTTPPPKISNDPSWYKCSYCQQLPVCHFKQPPAKNCRTCAWVEVQDGGAWRCNRGQIGIELEPGNTIPEALQRTGCDHYTVLPCF